MPVVAVAIAGQPEIALNGAQLSGRFAVMVVPARPAVAPRLLWLKIPPPSVPAELPVIELLLTMSGPPKFSEPGPLGRPGSPGARGPCARPGPGCDGPCRRAG